MNRTRRLLALAASSLIVVSLLAPAVSAAPSEDTLQRARQAVAIGRETAQGMAAEALGQVNRARGLERATEAIAAAAARKAARDQSPSVDGSRPGRGLGRGHAAEVRAILLAGGSPSELPPHGLTVRDLARAFDKVKADNPGLKLGHSKSAGSDADG